MGAKGKERGLGGGGKEGLKAGGRIERRLAKEWGVQGQESSKRPQGFGSVPP